MKPDLERELRRRIAAGDTARVVVHDFAKRGAIASPKQVWRTLEKWCDRGEYNFGVCLDLGWLTDKGRALLEQPTDELGDSPERG